MEQEEDTLKVTATSVSGCLMSSAGSVTAASRTLLLGCSRYRVGEVMDMMKNFFGHYCAVFDSR